MLIPFLLSFIPAFGEGFKELKTNRNAVKDKHRLTDFFSVLRGLGFFLVLEVIAILAFLILPQGRDTVLMVSENLNTFHLTSSTFLHLTSFIFLLGGVFLWSITSEFGARYAIYVTDNSGKSLSDERVQWRKSLQKAMAAAFLLLPSLVVMAAILLNWLSQSKESDQVPAQCFYIPIIFLYWIFCILTRLYFPNRRGQWYLSSAALDGEERIWTGKLYGIYNDFVYTFPKPENFEKSNEATLDAFTRPLTTNQTASHNFPTDKNLLIPSASVPSQFEFVSFDSSADQNSGLYRWIYRIPLIFYKYIHRQIRVIALITIALFIGIALLPVEWGWYEFIGSPALLAIAFTCWSGIYIGLLYVDYALLRGRWFSLRVVLIILLFVFSYINKDHPIRLEQSASTTHRDTLTNHFKGWLANYKKLFPINFEGPYPVVFVCAEGGALRTGAYTALFLTRLQERLSRDTLPLDFKSSVFAMSGVSGGSLGLSCFNAMNYLAKPGELKNDTLSRSAEDFFSYDELSPVIGKMFFGDIINLFLPRMVNRFDRAEALERAWENAYEGIAKKGNIYQESYLQRYVQPNLPVLVINTTEVETGYQCWLSTVIPQHLNHGNERDLLQNKITRNIRYSTAINFSTRFPLFSPGGMLQLERDGGPCKSQPDSGLHKLHYVDGGYFENTGAGSLVELLNELQRDDSIRQQIRPIVILLRFSNETSSQDINFGNELTEILGGLYDTRGGHSHIAVENLVRLVKHFRLDGVSGIVIDEPLSATQREVPMNWALSNISIGHIRGEVDAKLRDRRGVGIIPILTDKSLHFPVLRTP